MLNYLELHRYMMLRTKPEPVKLDKRVKLSMSWKKAVRDFFKKIEKT